MKLHSGVESLVDWKRICIISRANKTASSLSSSSNKISMFHKCSSIMLKILVSRHQTVNSFDCFISFYSFSDDDDDLLWSVILLFCSSWLSWFRRAERAPLLELVSNSEMIITPRQKYLQPVAEDIPRHEEQDQSSRQIGGFHYIVSEFGWILMHEW